ncbi:MAG TPA: type II toxin-antitoxin system VapB family antitoxin [Verrucomicrobiota bacterium]|nr:type II toxin-antitoxin system VapB family antitoxin [Verrucomicrobiota bacterium]HNU49569.1 type II toxin-antitoxin system VapB family antitoxin [Verrucomicrobiota bacterium]
MTLRIDEALLRRVMVATGTSSKTAAIDLALREMDRRARLVQLASEGLGLSPTELKTAFDPASTPHTAPLLAEKPPAYGRRPRARR